MFYKFPCGCSFPVIQESKDPDILPFLDFDFDEIPYDCSATWDLLARGITKGVFQLESQLGRTWTKKLKPEHIEHLAALGALLRPGCLRAIDEKHKCSMTELYCRRKNGLAEIEYIHPALEPVLKQTFGVLAYQEQSMDITRVIALFTLQMADELRKAIGKKLPEEMAKVKPKFFEGAKKAGLVIDEQAQEIFGWIEKSQRYSFNKSHAVSYGINGYLSAYAKAHGPVQFYTSWLYYAKDKQDPHQEIKELINDAKLLDVVVLPPEISTLEPHFATDGKVITFGLSDVKGIGEAQIEKLKTNVDKVCKLLGKPLSNFTWYEILIHLTPLLSTTLVTRLISVGAFRKFGSNRSKMLDEYDKWNNLTAKEQEWIRLRSLNGYAKLTLEQTTKGKEAQTIFDLPEEIVFDLNSEDIKSIQELPVYSTLSEALNAGAKVRKEGGAASNYKRKEIMESLAKLLDNPPNPIEDTPNWISWNEENLLGIPLTCSKIDSCDISSANCTCKEFLAGRTGYMVFAVQIESVRVITTKNGKSAGSKMAFLSVADNTCAVEMVAFPQAWKEYGQLLTEGNTVAIQGKRDKNGSLIIEKVFQI